MEQSIQGLPDMALFVAVAQAGNFRQAAARLGLPVSTLSRRIAAMEARLGMPLLLRTTRSVKLTQAATPYFERCLEVLEAAARAQAALVTHKARPTCIRVAMPVDLGVELLGPVVADFAQTQPGLRLEFDLSARAVDLFREPIDVAFRIGKPMDERLVARRVAEIPSGLYAAPAFVRSYSGRLDRAEQLASVPCLDLRTAIGSMAWRVGERQWDAAPGPSTLAANSVSLLRKLVESGHGVALLPQHMASDSVRSGRLERVLPKESTPVWPVYAVTVGRQLPERVHLLLTHVRSVLQTQIEHSSARGKPASHLGAGLY